MYIHISIWTFEQSQKYNGQMTTWPVDEIYRFRILASFPNFALRQYMQLDDKGSKRWRKRTSSIVNTGDQQYLVIDNEQDDIAEHEYKEMMRIGFKGRETFQKIWIRGNHKGKRTEKK